MKKRQAQDATREYDVAPLRDRIKTLEAAQKADRKRIKALERDLTALTKLVNEIEAG